jgi:hypothetical protein
MVRVIAIAVRSRDRDERRPAQRHHDDHTPAGWAPERTPKDEPYIANKNLALGQWLTRAEANSGPKIAPGCGMKREKPR